MTKYKFPKHFVWGASTASHQVEGGTLNQWSIWELSHAQELARTAEQRVGHTPEWEHIKKQATDPNNYVSGKGVDHYNRYREDFDIVKSLHLSAFRFGIEWSRLEPVEGVWDEKAVAHYLSYIKELKKRNIEPFLNIWHWTMPTWFTDKGGFTKRSNLAYFDRFVQKIADEYGHEITYVITLNEPNVYSTFSYTTGEWPPQEKNMLNFFKVYWNLTRAHK
nr:glycoside hydrolase family 1 protein [Candidatus Saccharibacteria bacterium]